MTGGRLIVVVDAGSTRIRCLVFDSNGDAIAQRSADWVHRAVDGASPYARELDAEAAWRTTARLVAESVGDRRTEARRIAAVTVTSQRQGVVFLDRKGSVLYAGPNVDLRAVFEGAAIDDAMGSRVFETTGRRPSFLFAPARLRWFMQHKPEVYERIDRVAPLADWLRWKLSGELVSEHTLAAEAGLLDVRERRRCAALLGDMGLPASDTVPLAAAGAVVGKVGREAAEVSGLPRNTPVVVSAADTQCGLLGLGVARPGQAGVVAGWSAPVLMLTDTPVFDRAMRTWTGCYVEDSLWSLESTCGDAGNSYRWLADTMWAGEAGPFDRMDEAAQQVPAGSDGVMAFLGPSRMDMGRVGLRTGGLVFPVPLTFADLGRGHAARAALEAMSFAVRANLEQLESVNGVTASSVAVGGGMTATSSWVEMLPNALGRPVEVASAPNVTASGAYLTAAAALDGAVSLPDYAEANATTTAIEPRAVDSVEYDDLYGRWNEMAGSLEAAGT